MKDLTDLDRLIIEYLSHDIYRKGKKPPADINIRRRVSKRIWREEGVDLDILEKSGIRLDEMADASGILKWEEMKVPVGLFRRKRERRILTDLGSLRRGVRDAGNLLDGKDHPNVKALSNSRLIFPLMVSSSADPLSDIIERLPIPAEDQKDNIEMSLVRARRTFMPEVKRSSEDEDLVPLFEKKVPPERSYRFRSGMKANTLKTLIEGVLDSDSEEIREMVERGVFTDFIGKGLKSPSLEASFRDLAIDMEGSAESGEGFRSRLGRFLMESSLGDVVSSEIVSERIERLMKCSEGEARRIRESIPAFVDGRCAPVLKDLLYRVPPENREVVMELMAETGSRSVVEPLKRMHEFSNSDRDRNAAKKALKSLGVGF